MLRGESISSRYQTRMQLTKCIRPAAFVCAMGIANILLVVYRTGQARHAGGPGALSLAIIILTFTLTTLWIVYAVILHHKIRAARHRDEARRQRSSTTLHSTHSHPQHHPSAYSDDELLRQQLSQLLQRSAERETPATGFWRSLWPWSSRSKTTSHMPLSDSQIDLVRSTFHIDMPSPSSGATAEHYRRQSHPNINPAATRPYSPDQRRYRNPFLDPDSARAAASVRSSQSGPPGETHELHSPQHANPNTGPSAYLPISQAENFSPPPTSNQFKQTYYHSPSSPQPAEIHEAPPQFHARNGWGRSTSPPPTTTRKTIRNEPSQRELRRAEIELGIVGPGPMLGGLRRA